MSVVMSGLKVQTLGETECEKREKLERACSLTTREMVDLLVMRGFDVTINRPRYAVLVKRMKAAERFRMRLRKA